MYTYKIKVENQPTYNEWQKYIYEYLCKKGLIKAKIN